MRHARLISIFSIFYFNFQDLCTICPFKFKIAEIAYLHYFCSLFLTFQVICRRLKTETTAQIITASDMFVEDCVFRWFGVFNIRNMRQSLCIYLLFLLFQVSFITFYTSVFLLLLLSLSIHYYHHRYHLKHMVMSVQSPLFLIFFVAHC